MPSTSVFIEGLSELREALDAEKLSRKTVLGMAKAVEEVHKVLQDEVFARYGFRKKLHSVRVGQEKDIRYAPGARERIEQDLVYEGPSVPLAEFNHRSIFDIQVPSAFHASYYSEVGIFGGNDFGSLSAGIGMARANSGNWDTHLRFYTHISSTSGSPADITEKMRITGDGNVEVKSAGELRVYRSDNARYGTFYNDNSYVHIAASTDPIRISSITRTEFYVSGTERMRTTSVGSTLLIGTSSPTWEASNRALLELNHTGSALIGLKINDTQKAYFYHNNVNLYIENMLAGGSIYVISNSAGVYLTSGGTSWTSNSDERLKNINGEIENAVDKLMTLRTVNYSWKNDETEKENLGLIAQDVEKVFPELIDKNKLPSKPNENQEDETEYLGVRYQELIPVLVKAIQEQQSTICSQSQKIAILESCLGIM
jgi:hypothetical protein